MTILFYTTTTLFVLCCIFLILLVLIQKGRGGGLSSAFGGAGGNTAFLVGGSVGVGKHFRATNAATGAVLEETFTGRGIADDRLFYCRFLFEDVPTPSGTIDILFEVWGLPTPQGP